LVVAAAITMLSVAPTYSATVSFPGTGTSYFSASSGSGLIPSGGISGLMQTAGDNVSETFNVPGLISVSSLTTNHSIFNSASPGPISWNVLVNGVIVGAQSATACFGCIKTFADSFTFAPIVGNGVYTLAFVLTTTGGGVVVFRDGGEAILSGETA